LGADQQVVIIAYTPNAVPDEAVRRTARAGLEETFAAVQKHAAEQGVTSAEADAAVEEAMQHIRRRSS